MADRSAVYTIPINDAESNGIELGNDGLVAFQMPDGWDAAGVFFEARTSSTGTWATLRCFDYPNQQGDSYYVASAHILADNVYVLPVPIAGIFEVRIVSGAPGATVNQSAERVITPQFRRVY